MGSTTVHMSLSVRGALTWSKARLKQIIRDTETGRWLGAEEAREWLMDRLSEGIEVLPMGECDGHDPKTGCPGHRKESAA